MKYAIGEALAKAAIIYSSGFILLSFLTLVGLKKKIKEVSVTFSALLLLYIFIPLVYISYIANEGEQGREKWKILRQNHEMISIKTISDLCNDNAKKIYKRVSDESPISFSVIRHGNYFGNSTSHVAENIANIMCRSNNRLAYFINSENLELFRVCGYSEDAEIKETTPLYELTVGEIKKIIPVTTEGYSPHDILAQSIQINKIDDETIMGEDIVHFFTFYGDGVGTCPKAIEQIKNLINAVFPSDLKIKAKSNGVTH